MQKLTAVASLVVAGFLLTSCSNTDARLTATGPTAVAADSPSFTLTSSNVIRQSVRAPFSFCPAVAPFTVLLNLGVTAGSLSLSVIELGVRFVDTSGVSTTQVTLPGPVPTTQFGTALVQARQTSIFPLAVGLGCGTGVRGTITVVVITRNQIGGMHTGQVSAFLR
jgi:hypothetical protein